MTAVRGSLVKRSGGWCAWVAGLWLCGTLVACAPIDVRSKPGTTTTVIMTRHADRDPDSQELNAIGRERATALVDVVRDMGVTAIYSPNVERNVATVRPLARELGIEITITPETSVYIAESIAREMLDRHAGGVIV
ncbi:MAG: histidine phosphatase family protein, partial [Burkholderiaceae bacterium]